MKIMILLLMLVMVPGHITKVIILGPEFDGISERAVGKSQPKDLGFYSIFHQLIYLMTVFHGQLMITITLILRYQKGHVMVVYLKRFTFAAKLILLPMAITENTQTENTFEIMTNLKINIITKLVKMNSPPSISGMTLTGTTGSFRKNFLMQILQ